MPDFEIRYFYTDGSLAVVHITSVETTPEAEEYAKRHLQDYAQFEVREIGPRAGA
ncbi:MAG TPA: hypothetical protein VMF58_07195 [Rhizomicrobium sp.]|nr:hypothetical protein [Rhizomicrobium sp.]